MSKNAIKVIKRNKKAVMENDPALGDVPSVEREARLSTVNIVEIWISERRENSRLEKVFSDDKISNWKTIPEDFEQKVASKPENR